VSVKISVGGFSVFADREGVIWYTSRCIL